MLKRPETVLMCEDMDWFKLLYKVARSRSVHVYDIGVIYPGDQANKVLPNRGFILIVWSIHRLYTEKTNMFYGADIKTQKEQKHR